MVAIVPAILVAAHPHAGAEKGGVIHIHCFEIEVTGADQFSFQWGSVMHGMLIDMLPASWQEQLHVGAINPLSQWIVPNRDRSARWHIQTLDDDLADAVAQALADHPTLYCRHIHRTVAFGKITHRCVSMDEIISDAVDGAYTGLRLRFTTPVSHKSQGRYVNLPTLPMIGRSIAKRISAFAPDMILADEDVLQQVLDACEAGRYMLQTVTYQLEGKYVPAYSGWMEIRYLGDPAVNSLAHVLFSLAPFTGIGIKTTLGMGGCQIESVFRKGEKRT